MNLRIWQKVIFLMLIPLTFEIVSILILASEMSEAQALTERYKSTEKVLTCFHQAENLLSKSLLSFGNAPNLDEAAYQTALRELTKAKQLIESSATSSESIRNVLSETPELFDDALSVIDRIHNVARKHPGVPPLQASQPLRANMYRLALNMGPLLQKMMSAESHLQVIGSAELTNIRFKILATAVTLALGSLIISFFVARIFYRNIGTTLNTIEENANRIAARKELLPPLSGSDELIDVDHSLHKAASYIASVYDKELAIVNKSADVLCSLDTRYKILTIGESVQKSWHYPVDYVLGRSLPTLLSEEDATSFRASLANKAEGEIDIEARLLCGDKTMRDIGWKIKWTPEENCYYCVARDISEWKNITRAKARLVAIASHDLRSPLTSISSNLSAILAGKFGELDKAVTIILTKAERSLERLMILIRDLLELEKFEAGKVSINLACVSALDICNEAIDSLETLTENSEIRIVRPVADASILADDRRLLQVLINLLSNAIKYSPRDGVITVAVKSVGSYVELSVSDQGPGIAKEEQALVFDKYYQTASKPEQTGKSTGLGLAVAKVMTDAQSGSIGVESDLGKGSRFYVRLPQFVLPDSEDTFE